ncbi:hypothetical protein ACET3Z_010604 [Daucus carota]
MKATGASIQIPCDADVFGAVKTIFVLQENLISLLEFDMIGQSVVGAYMAYLHHLCYKDRKKDDALLFGFLDPASTYTLNKEFQNAVVKRLMDNYYRLYLMPHNQMAHWILVVIWDDDLYILNPLPHNTRFPDLERGLIDALASYHAQSGRAKRTPKVVYLMWAVRSRNCYTEEELDEVRMEALEFIEDKM